MKSKREKKEKRQGGDARGFNRLSQWLHGLLSGILSSFRLSLTFRIAMHYCWQLLSTTLLVCLVVTCFYGGLQLSRINNLALRVAAASPDEDAAYGPQLLQDSASSDATREYSQRVLQDSAAYAQWSPESLPSDSSERRQAQLRALIRGVKDFSSPSLLLLKSAYSGGSVVLRYDLTELLKTWGWLMLAIFTSDALRMIHFLRKRNQLDKRVLAPIRDITDMAATLSASNLSNRINIAGTKNELKDLATVINTMLDRIERSYNSQKQFVSDASHELRTPIAVIQGYVNMLQRWGKDDKTILDEGINAIAQEAASMKDLVESLLFLARHDKKTLMMEVERFDPCDVVAELHREAAMVTPEDRFILSPVEHCTIEADRGMIKQVMRILCDNAVKYTPKGGTITMGVESYPGGCTLVLSDTGPGISREELPKIFDRFYRSDSARKAESGGHGLGLSIARIIIVAHGGKIRVRSKPGEGTTFSVVLPERQPQHTANL